MSVKIFVGVDPGKSGTIGYCSSNGKHGVLKMPEELDDIVTALAPSYFHRLCGSLIGDVTYVLESVHSSPQMGATSAFTFGRNFGWLEAILRSMKKSSLHVEDLIMVTPQRWQAALNCRTGGDKHISLARAKELFPSLDSITLRTADALLLAYYGYMKHGSTTLKD